jgi:replication factor C small subunit
MCRPFCVGPGTTAVALSAAQAVWVEKYRPHTLSEIVGQEAVVPVLEAYARKKTMPHLLFAGPPGTGKTTAAIALVRDIYGEEWRQNFLELNSSDERGIDTVRTTIKNYARTAPLGDVGFRTILLDESDAMTSEAQNSLRRLMERYSGVCRFVLSCNYSSRIIEPIQSRCAVFRFRPLDPERVKGRLRQIARAEGKKITDDGLEAILSASEGDLRRAINFLQLAATFSDTVDEKSIGEVVTVPMRSEIRSMVDEALKGNFMGARDRLFRLFAERGASGEDIVRAIHTYLPSLPASAVSDRDKLDLIEALGETDYRLAEGANDRIQLEVVLARLARLHTAAR